MAVAGTLASCGPHGALLHTDRLVAAVVVNQAGTISPGLPAHYVQAGVDVAIHQLPSTVSQRELESEVAQLCADPHVDGVLIQLPLPQHLCEEAVMEHLDPKKDVDGFHPLNMG